MIHLFSKLGRRSLFGPGAGRQRLFTTTLVSGALAAGMLGMAGPAHAAKQISAEVASFETLIGRPQRLLVGLSDNDGNSLSGGTVTFELQRSDASGPKVKAEAHFQPIALQHDPGGPAKLRPPSKGLGVYAAQVNLPSVGYWDVNVKGPGITAKAALLATDHAQIPNVGDAAPKTQNLVMTTPKTPLQAIDSRGGDGDKVPDPELHKTIIADAIAAKRPLVIVASTPVYCQSRFCGPVTDLVSKLAKKYPAVAFVHLEIWRDFEKKMINKGAAEWMLPKNGDEGHEPWVWLVGRNG